MILSLQDKDSMMAARLLCSREQKSGSRIGLTSGCYDLYHIYHLEYFVRCRRRCDILVVGVNSDRLVKEEKDEFRPIFPESDRLKIIDSVGVVTIAFVMDNIEEFAQVVEFLEIDVIFKNDAFKDRDDIAGADKAEVIIVPDVEQLTSTTTIIDKIQRIEKQAEESRSKD